MWRQARNAQLRQERKQQTQSQEDDHGQDNLRRGGRGGHRGRGGRGDLGHSGGRGGRGINHHRGGGRGSGQQHFRGRGQYSDRDNVDRGQRGHFQPRGRGFQHHGKAQPHATEDKTLDAMPETPKPWVDFHLQTQVYLRDSLQKNAKKSRKAEDFEKYCEQRAKVLELEQDLMNVFFKNNPSQERFWLPLLAMESARNPQFCDNCEKCFKNQSELIEHEKEHEVCNLDGCTFTSDVDVLKEHVLTLHATGLYARMVHGYDAEEVKKWKAERKLHYPTTEMTLRKRAKLEEKRKQGQKQQERREEELQERKVIYKKVVDLKKELSAKNNLVRNGKEEKTLLARKRKRNKKSSDGGSISQKAKVQEDKKSKVTPGGNEKVRDEDESDPEGYCMGVPMFRGIQSLMNEESFEDIQISSNQNVCKNVLQQKDEENDNKSEDDDEAPDEVVIERKEVEGTSTESPVIIPEEESTNNEVSAEKDSSMEAQESAKKISYVPDIEFPERFKGEKSLLTRLPKSRPPTLLEKLLVKEIREERSELLQCVNYICENNFFQMPKL